MVSLATHKILVSLHAVVGLKLFATTVAVNHMATALPNIVLLVLLKTCHRQTLYIFCTCVLQRLLAAVKHKVTLLVGIFIPHTAPI